MRRAIGDGPFTFGQTNDSSRPGNALTLLHELRPLCWSKKCDETGIDEIEGVVGKVKWFSGILYHEVRVAQVLQLGSRICIIDHRSADVEPYHLGPRIGIGSLECPAARSTADIQDVTDTGEVRPLWKQAAHSFRDEAILIRQAGHFRATLGVIEIDVVLLG